jgi:amino-acid N-acetyltransferase
MENASAQDWNAIRDLLTLCGLSHVDLTPESLADFFVIRDPGGTALLGTAGWEHYGRAGLLRSVAVAPGSRGQSWGKWLVSRIESAAIESGVEEMFLLTVTAPDFFLALGYQAVAREAAPALIRESTQFASLCPSTAICLSKKLLASQQRGCQNGQN